MDLAKFAEVNALSWGGIARLTDHEVYSFTDCPDGISKLGNQAGRAY